MILPGFVFLFISVILLLKALTAFEGRDTRYSKGVKIKENKIAIIYFSVTIMLLLIAIIFFRS